MFRILCSIRRHLFILWNRYMLRYNHIYYGKNCMIFDACYIRNEGTAIIGNDFLLTSDGGYNPLARNLKAALVVNRGASVIIGNRVHCSSVCIWARKQKCIGDNVKIGAGTIFIDSNAHSLSYEERRDDVLDARNAVSKAIVVGNDVLIGTMCIILKGVHIGERSVIGAGSVVTQDIPADSIAAGNPCRVIKTIKKD